MEAAGGRVGGGDGRGRRGAEGGGGEAEERADGGEEDAEDEDGPGGRSERGLINVFWPQLFEPP